MNTRRAQAARRTEHDLTAAIGDCAHGAEGIEVRVKAPAADHVAAGRRHDGTVKAREQRSRQQERGADQLGELRLDFDLAHVGGAQRDLVWPAPVHLHADRAEDAEHRVDVADARNVAHDHLILGEDAGREDRESPVLVPSRNHRAGKRSATFDDELLHELYARPSAPQGLAGLAPGKRNSHVTAQVRAARPLPCLE